MIERTRHRYDNVHRLLDRGRKISAITRVLGLDRETVRRFKTTDPRGGSPREGGAAWFEAAGRSRRPRAGCA
jgi:hypothetical protein